MAKYTIKVWGGLVTYGYEFESNSRNSKKHIIDTGADHCEVFTKSGVQVSSAVRDSETGKPFNICF